MLVGDYYMIQEEYRAGCGCVAQGGGFTYVGRAGAGISVRVVVDKDYVWRGVGHGVAHQGRYINAGTSAAAYGSAQDLDNA